MSTLKIELINGYYIEVDELNHTLKQRYTGKTKDGQEKEVDRIIGYFSSVQGCVERVCKLIPLEENDGAVISMKQYAEAVQKAVESVCEVLGKE